MIIPESVIKEAVKVGGRGAYDREQWIHGFAPDDFEPSRFQSGETMGEFEAGIAAAAPVIAAWARDQERERIREAIGGPEALGAAHEVGLRLANSDGPKEVPAGDYLGGSAMVAGILLAGLDTALAALDREGEQ